VLEPEVDSEGGVERGWVEAASGIDRPLPNAARIKKLYVFDVWRFEKKEELVDYLLRSSYKYAVLKDGLVVKQGYIAEEDVKKIMQML
jgi:hypothetical protein